MTTKDFPDILAVDPRGCGCTECIIGEYIPEDVWVESATAADLVAVLTAQVANHTSNSTFDLVVTNFFPNDSAADFQRRYLERLDRNLDAINQILDPEEIEGWC